MQRIEKWDVFEVSVKGKAEGNPFTDYTIQGTFCHEKEQVTVDGFYDGEGIYKVRFMPSYEGIYTYEITGNFADTVAPENVSGMMTREDSPESAVTGSFEAVAVVGEKNHGRVQVVDKAHLAYEDGTPYFSMGTTCYAWVNQTMELQEQTLETLENSPFNKIRFCIFPKFYDYNKKEPITYPYERGNGEGIDDALVVLEEKGRILFPGQLPPVLDMDFNYYRFNLEHFKRFDLRIRQLRDMGIEADIILMHPYDKWGLNMMNKECCDLYVKYVVARFGAYRNVWWSLANEYDIMSTKTEADWERYAAIICEKDVYGHLRSIHNCMRFYDYSRPWITHCSMQRIDFYRHAEYTDEYMAKYEKPVVWDELGYEGNIQLGWGNLTPQEMVRRFWETFLRGGHAGHGETYLDPEDILWWSHGGILKGESGKRIQFLLDIAKETPGNYLEIGKGMFDECVGVCKNEQEKQEKSSGNPFELKYYSYQIHYLGINQPFFRMFFLPEGMEYEIDVIDTWEMTVTPLGVHRGATRVELPQKPYMAIRLRRIE